MCVQICSCPGGTACCRAKSTERDAADVFKYLKTEDLSVNIKTLKNLKAAPRYLEQIRRDVETEVLPVLLLQLHSLIEEHVGTVCLQVQHMFHY